MVVKHRESWIRMKHGHETLWIWMKQCFIVMKRTVPCQWNTLHQGRWPQRYLFSYIEFWFIVFHGVSLRCFILFHCCFMPFHCCFIAVSCCFIAVSCCFIAVSLLFRAVSRSFTALFHSVSRCFIALFQGVSRCFIALFHPVLWPWNRCSMSLNIQKRVCLAYYQSDRTINSNDA